VRILIVDDDAEVRRLLVQALERDGHSLATAASLESARAALVERSADVLVLDLGLPDGSGVELCRALRRAKDSVPILVLTARSEVAKRVEALDAGADDFLAKPFALAELRARVRALGRRRARGVVAIQLVFGDVAIDLATRKARRAGTSIAMTPREWSILDALAAREGRLVSRQLLLDEVWGEATEQSSASLEVLIGRIRRKLGQGSVRTVRGEGYALGER
jgi:two-component system OmpR family response regulator